MFLCAQEKYTISGYIKDSANGESLIGATVVLRELSAGNITNVYGFYSITVPKGAPELSEAVRRVGVAPLVVHCTSSALNCTR